MSTLEAQRIDGLLANRLDAPGRIVILCREPPVTRLGQLLVYLKHRRTLLRRPRRRPYVLISAKALKISTH
jgi:hypothetical protein